MTAGFCVGTLCDMLIVGKTLLKKHTHSIYSYCFLFNRAVYERGWGVGSFDLSCSRRYEIVKMKIHANGSGIVIFDD